MNIEFKNVLVTGAAGFIGYHLSKRLIKDGFQVTGVDNLNPYYDVRLKKDRLAELVPNDRFTFYRVDLAERDGLEKVVVLCKNGFDQAVTTGSPYSQ